jgi:hypothetical protein
MKKLFYSLIAVLASAISSYADVGNGTPFVVGDAHVVLVKDSISSNTTWTNDNVYILQGFVYVTAGTTLTINAGCLVVGDKNSKGTLIVERDAKIMANGTKDLPIVFTSNEPQGFRSYGDWGGIIICGKASTNFVAGQAQVEGGPRSFYGGTSDNDNSGKLSYMRIEFGGIAYQPNSEVNGLTLCAVGDATQIDHVQISYSGDDAFEWFGGTVNSKYLVTLGTWDDDFDTDAKYVGKNQFCVVVRDPNAADQSGSKAFESDSYLTGSVSGLADTLNATKCIFSNVTAIGPVAANPCNASFSTNYVAAVHLRKGSGQSILNSVFVGWPAGVLIDESSSSYGSTVANLQSNMMQFRNNIIAGTYTSNCTTPNPINIVYVKNGARDLTPTGTNADTTTGNPFAPYSGPYNWLKAGTAAFYGGPLSVSYGNIIYATEGNGTKLQNPFAVSIGQPLQENLTPTSSSPIRYNNRALPSYIPTGTFPGNVYPFNPTKPINTDTSSLFVNYNCPIAPPDFTNNKANDAFFDRVNFIGAMSTDNWMHGWTNWDPNQTYYVPVGVKNIKANSFGSIGVYPNPAQNKATVVVDMKHNADLQIAMFDITGKKVKEVFSGKKESGKQLFEVSLDGLNNGLYFVNVASEDKVQTVKISVIK